jgi:twitching motility two-component system response regulator PilG
MIRNGSGCRVLVIDDSQTVRRSAEIFLAQGGHQVLLAEDGFDALSRIDEQAPDLIFCDIQMPRLDGYRTCAIVRRHPALRDVPVVMLSSNEGLFDQMRGQAAGAREHIAKPFAAEQLLDAVRRLVPGRGAEAFR